MPGTRPGIVNFAEWQKAILDSPELRDYHAAERKAGKFHYDIRLTALMIAKHGANGRGCFASSPVIAREIGCGRRVVEAHRKALIARGWFTVVTRSGGDNRRSMVLDIAFPDTGTESVRPVPASCVPTRVVEGNGRQSAPVAESSPAPVAREPRPDYGGVFVFGADGADAWDDDGDDMESSGPPVRAWGSVPRAWDRG
jgi:hypothetical protein